MDAQYIRWMFVRNLYERYENEVYKTCLCYAKDEHIARDMTQKTFISIYEHYDNIHPGRMRPYLLQAAKNITLNFLRDFKRLREGQIQDLNDENLKISSVEDMYLRKECRNAAVELTNSIMEALYDKNKRWYELVMLAYYFDIPQERIARNMGLRVDVVYSRLYRAKQWIRKNYQKDYDEFTNNTEH